MPRQLSYTQHFLIAPGAMCVEGCGNLLSNVVKNYNANTFSTILEQPESSGHEQKNDSLIALKSLTLADKQLLQQTKLSTTQPNLVCVEIRSTVSDAVKTAFLHALCEYHNTEGIGPELEVPRDVFTAVFQPPNRPKNTYASLGIIGLAFAAVFALEHSALLAQWPGLAIALAGTTLLLIIGLYGQNLRKAARDTLKKDLAWPFYQAWPSPVPGFTAQSG